MCARTLVRQLPDLPDRLLRPWKVTDFFKHLILSHLGIKVIRRVYR